MDMQILFITALSIGFIHTLIGPDHYLPFIVLSKARNWPLAKTCWITFLCGVGHVLGSVVLGCIGIAFGFALNILVGIESIRGELASWLLIGFGLAYGTWGFRRGLRESEHAHEHAHAVGRHHQHSHHHLGNHVHLHSDAKSLTPWVMFVIFVLGPCEPLIPILMYPAAQGNWIHVLWVSLAFGVPTILTMLGIVVVTSLGLMRVKLDFMERYVHALAGIIIAVSGLTIKIFGL
ncbi:MAG: sulfite exporter TauE/SafE family protein [Deltaproteobacteria bacterium]|nr:sulfite exporter TauE/SafE family protein [Deltaproteobacteria bacterium]